MNLDDAATAAVGSPTVATPHPTGSASNGGGMSIDDAAGLAVQQANAGTAATIKNNLYNAAAQSPDAAAANQSLARAANVPVETVAANPTPIKQQLAAQNTDATALIQTAPATAQFLANPNNAAIAHDDIPNLTAIEQGLASSPFDHYVQRAGRDLITAGSFMNPYTAISQVAFDIPNHLGGAGMQTLMQKYPGMIDELAKILPDNPAVANFFANNPTSPTVGGLFNKLGEAMFPGGAAETKGGQLFDAGASMAGAGSLMNAGTIAGKVWNTMTAATAGVAGAEIQPKAEAWAKENFPTNPFMQELISQAAGLASMIGTAAAGHAFTGAVDNAAQSHLAGTTKAAQADAVADHMTQINDLAAQSKVRQRDPQAFSDFVANATENAPIKDVYIDAKQFAQVAGEQLPQLAQALPDVAEQLPVALSTGGDIRIPVSDFASKLAGSDIAAQLIPHLKTDPEGFSQVEAQEHMATMGDQIQSDVSSRLAAAPEDAAKQAGVDAVQQKVMDQLTQANRFTSDVNQPYAQLVANFYSSMADRAGVTPEELYEQHPLNIKAENVAGGFDQAAYHGSPHDFDKFDLGMVGTGEGAQAYGWGQYFAENKDVAEGYRKKLTKDLFKSPDGSFFDPVELNNPNLRVRARENGTDIDTTIKQAKELLGRLKGTQAEEVTKQDLAALEGVKAKGDLSRVDGQTYQIHVPDEHVETMLDWDKPYSEQSEQVKDALYAAARRYEEGETDTPAEASLSQILQDAGDSTHPNHDISGEMLYEILAHDMHGVGRSDNPTSEEYRKTSEYLAAIGIPGIRYLDEGSRGYQVVLSTKDGEYARTNFSDKDSAARYAKEKGEDGFGTKVVQEGTRNYVIHDQTLLDKLSDSINKLYQGRLGSYHPASATISLMKGANLSTFLHESGHFFLDKMIDIATSEKAPGDVKADTQTLMDWLGVKDAETFKSKPIDQQRIAHEQFARTFEKYLIDGKAPSLEMQPIFSRFRSWLLSVYQSAQNFLGLHPEAGGISDEMRSVFDRMLATDSDIQKAQTARGMTPMFKTPEEAGMNEEEFKQYQDAQQSAVETAQSELDSRRLRDMQYASNARSETIKALQREAASKRAAIREEVTKEIQKEPVYAAEQYLKTGEDFDGTHSLGPVKLSAGGLKDIGVPDEIIAAMKRQKLAADEGIHPDAIANAFGFNSGQGLVEALANAEPLKDRIRGMTDQRMLERHGDLTDPASIARAADAAIHNDVRTKIITTELNALNKQLGNKSLLTRAAKQFAEKIVAELPANKINPNQYIAAAAKAAKLADKAFKAGDLKEAAEQKKNQLVNQYAVKAAFEQKALVDKGLSFLNKFGNKAFREKVAGPYLEQIDGILAKYDLRKNPSDRPTRAETNLATWVKSQRDAGFEPYVPDFILNGDPQHYGDMSVEKFKGLVDTVRSMKHMSDNLNEVTIAGQKMALDYAVKELLKPMQDRGDKFTKEELLNPKQFKTDPFLQTALEKMGSTLRLIDSDLKPIEFKRNEYDLHDLQGPFGKYIFEPMFERNYWKVEQLRNISREFGAAGDRLGKDWQDGLYNLVENKTLLDPDLTTRDKNGTVIEPSYLKMTRAKMLGIARHVGNESNFDKLTKGYNWNPVDVWKFLHDNMTEKDWQATQAHWDVFEKYWPEIEALMRRLGGVPPDKIPLRPFDTKFGKMKGGYAPIDYDPIRSKLSNKWGDVMSNPDEAIGQEQAYRATTTMNGSTQNRSAGYTDIVNLDYHSAEGRLRDTIHDLAYRETLIDSNKILNHPEFRSQFLKTFGREDYKGMQGWLRGIRDMNRDESQIRGFEKWLQYARSGVVMTGIAYRLSTVLKHGSSAALKSLGYLGDSTGAKYFAARAARMGTGNATADIQGAVAKFPEIASRMNQMDRDYKVGTRSMYQAEDWRAKNDRFGHAMVAWSDMLTAVPTAWAAYDRATVEGIPEGHGGTGKPMTEKQAVAYANKVVREAHGTALEANRSLFLQARGVKGLFGTIYGFMNNTYGQLGDLMDKTVVGGHFQNKPVLLARAMATIVAPAMIAGWINGQFDDKNHFFKNIGMALTGEVAGAVPFVRDAWSMIERQDTTGDSIAPIRVIGDTVKVALDGVKATEGKSSKWVQDIANALGELTHTGGLGQAGKTLQYLKDVHDGKQNPHNVKDFVTGATIGPPPQKK